jgi:ribosome-associated protein
MRKTVAKKTGATRAGAKPGTQRPAKAAPSRARKASPAKPDRKAPSGEAKRKAPSFGAKSERPSFGAKSKRPSFGAKSDRPAFGAKSDRPSFGAKSRAAPARGTSPTDARRKTSRGAPATEARGRKTASRAAPATDATSRKALRPKAPADAVAAAPRAEPAPERPDPSRPRAVLIAQAGLDKKAENVLVVDVRGLTSYADYFVLMTAESERQAGAIADSVDEKMKASGSTRVGSEGYETGRWILIDYGDVVAHVMSRDARGFYDLEGLWADAPHFEVT